MLPIRGLYRRKVLAAGLALLLVATSLFMLRPQPAFATTVTQFPSSVASNSWTSSTNAYANDNNLATAAPGKNGTVNGNWGTFGFNTTIPSDATINSVVINVDYRVSAANSFTTLNVQPLVGGAACGTTVADTSVPTVMTADPYDITACRSWSVSDLSNASLQVQLGAQKGNTNTSYTFYVDYISVSVGYTIPLTLTQASYRVFANQDTTAGTTFSQVMGGSSATDQATGIVQTDDGGYVVAGYSQNYGAGGLDILLTKYDGGGHQLWATTYGGVNNETAADITSCSDGGFVITGSTKSTGDSTAGDMYVAKFDANGNVSWSRTWNTASLDGGNQVIQTSDGGYVVIGTSSGVGTGSDLVIAKLDASGNWSWLKSWGGSGTDTGLGVVEASDGSLYVEASTNTSGWTAGGYDTALLKFTSAGALSWVTRWGGSGNDQGNPSTIALTSDGGVVIAGATQSFGDSASGDAFLVKFTSAGAFSWASVWGAAGTVDAPWGITAASDGSIAINGQTNSYGTGGQDAFLGKYDSSGNLLWLHTWGQASGNDVGRGLTQTSDGGYAAVGIALSFGDSTGDEYLNKYDAAGDIAGCGSYCTAPNVSSTSITGTTASISSSVTSRSLGYNFNGNQGSAVVPVNQIVPPTSAVVGSSLTANQNTAATVPGDGQPFRVRIDMRVTSNTLAVSNQSFKLQYAPLAGSCAATPSANFSDVTDTSPVGYYHNPNSVSGLALATNANDPTDGSNTLVRQSYQEKGTTSFTNNTAIPAGQDGMWDFALTTNQTMQNSHYCLRLASSSGTALNSYAQYPEIITPAATVTQANYRLFANQDSTNAYTFATAYGSTGTDIVTAVVQTKDGGYASTGYTNGYSSSYDMFISKYDSSGTLSWTKTWGGTGDDQGNSLAQTSDGGFVVTGAYNNDMFLAKYDSNGNLSWSNIWSGVTAAQGHCVIQTSDGGYAITGQTSQFSDNYDMFLAKYDSSGSPTWLKTWGDANLSSDSGNSLVQTSDGGYAVTGATSSFGAGGSDMFLAKYDSNGNLSWSKTRGGSGADAGQALVQTSDGGYAVTGYMTGVSPSRYMFVDKYDSSGSLLFSRTWDDNGWDDGVGSAIAKTGDGGFIVTGVQGLSDNGANIDNTFLLKYDSVGNLSWSRIVDAGGNEGGVGVAQTSDGGYVIASNITGVGQGLQDIYLAKFDSSGNIGGCSTICSPGSDTTPSLTITTGSPTVTTSSRTITNGSPAATASGVSMLPATLVAVASQPIVTVGTPLANVGKAGDIAGDSSGQLAFRLRVLLRVGNSGVAASALSLKLQYARQSGASCSATPSGNYADVGAATPVQFYNNTIATNGSQPASNVNDPTDGSNAISYQTYNETNGFTNAGGALYAGQDGLWDFPLAFGSGLTHDSFCLRIVTGSGSALGAYSAYPQANLGPLMKNLMSSGKWFNTNGIRQPLNLQ